MKSLFQGCRRSEIKVTPKNWNTKQGDINTSWLIYYRFYDPAYKHDPKLRKGKLVFIRGMNIYSGLRERQVATEALIYQEMELIDIQGYNPITGLYMVEQVSNDFAISPHTQVITAFREALKMATGVPGTLQDMRLTIDGIETAAVRLKLDDHPIGEISRRHIKLLLETCYKTNNQFTDKRFNKYRAWLMKLFNILLEVEAVQHNPVRDIKKKKVVKELITVLTQEQREKIRTELPKLHYPYYRYVQIFYNSGARKTELGQVKFENVDLPSQRYKVMVKKGKEWREVWKTIKDVALPYWQEIMGECQPGEYLFSQNFKPGDTPIGRDLVARYWKRLVMEGLKINVRFYHLKHLHTSEIVDLLGDDDAAAMNAHTSTAMVVNIYDVNREGRQHNRLKGAGNTL